MPSLDIVSKQSRSSRLIPDGARVVVTVRVMPMASVLFAVMTVTMNLIGPPKLKRMSLIVYKSGNSSRYTSLLLYREPATSSHVAFSSPFCVLHKRSL